MPTSTVENYLKQILVVSLETNCPEVPMGKVAQGLCVTSGTATTMIKNLAGKGWLNY
jgi:DtxR family Mn-dependent transcriptional regulator